MNIAYIPATKNACYIANNPLRPRGIVVHSTGANNPNLSRYVAPDDGLIGENKYGNSFNEEYPGGRSVCVHAFIGKLKDGRVATRQILPWKTEAWHTGGRANDTHIGFEMCEDGMNDKSYFLAVWREAVELCAYLCKEFGLDPLGDGVIISHKEAHERRLASNHGDPQHWFDRFGKTMDDFRRDVAEEMEEKQMDNTPAEWAREAVEWAVEAGLINGDGEGNLQLHQPVTREQLMVFLHRFKDMI